MQYDRDGFPIPARFEPPTQDDGGFPAWTADGGRHRRTTALDLAPAGDRATANPASGRRSGGIKRSLIAIMLLFGVVPALFGPSLLSTIGPLIVEWSWERSLEFEADDDLATALVEIDRAIAWHGTEDQQLLCRRAWLRLHAGDAAGAVDDARRAEAAAPLRTAPLRILGLAEVVRGNYTEALATARRVVGSRRDPVSLNHIAYLRALAGTELPEALVDIDEAIGLEGPAVSADILDTRGFVLHLLGRDDEALEQMEEALARQLAERQRMRLAAGRGGVSVIEARLRLREIEQGLAVMHQHRGLILSRMGNHDLAEKDFATARIKGFDPSRGVM